jgi:hypothetical protein
MEGLRERWKRSIAVLRAPRVRIEVYGDDEARAIHRAFTARHPRFRVVPRKRWGVALLRLPDAFDEYVGGHSKKVLRQKRRLAEQHGFRYTVVPPDHYIDDILAINRSAPTRQGRPMPESYTDREQVIRTFQGRTAIHAILDADGRLRAYAIVPVIGDAFVFSTILGHADDLEHGTMYLLVSEVIRTFIHVRRATGSPTWAMYDTFWGASKGLAYFKERLGFRPYTVDWVWADHGQ